MKAIALLKQFNNKSKFGLFNLNKFYFTQPKETIKKENIKPQSQQLQVEQKPVYVPLENRTPEQIQLLAEQKEREEYFYYGGKAYFNMSKQAAAFEFLAKAKRKSYLNLGYHALSKTIIPVKRLRTLDDNYLENAKKKNESVVIIQAREDFTELQLVVDMKYMQRIVFKKEVWSKFVYFQLPDGQEVKCLYENFEEHTYMNISPAKVYFNRFIYGKPNLVVIPIAITGISKNYYINYLNCEHHNPINKVKAWTLTDEIPKRIEISAELVDPYMKILVKDLDQFLPSNLHMHQSMNKIWWDSVFTVKGNDNVYYATRENPIEWDENDNDDIKELNEQKIDNVIDENTYKSKTKVKRLFDPTKVTIPYKKVSGKVLTSTKDKGADKESVMEYLQQQKKTGGSKPKKVKKKTEDDD